MNPDSFNNTNIIYKNIEMEQRKLGDLFWKKEYAKDYWIDIGDEKLYARLFISYPASKKWVICVHGYRSSGENDMAFVAFKFSEQGYNVLVPDLRGHGKSNGKNINMGWLDRLDILKWIDIILKINIEANIILVGGSMGASVVMMTSGEELPKNVKGIIADCGYTSVCSEFKFMLHSALKLPAFPIITFANRLAKKKVGFTLKQASAVKQLTKNTVPCLFIHGTGEKFVPHQMLYENMEATKGIKESLLIEHAPHLSSFIYEPNYYFETIFEFIKRYCSGEEENNG